MNVFKIGKIRYIHFEDGYQPFPNEKEMEHIIYSTDWHFGKKGKFRSDNMDEALFHKLEMKRQYKEQIEAPQVLECQGGDINDTPKINQLESYEFRSMEVDTISHLNEHIREEVDEFICGNHDIKHESDWMKCVLTSPLPLMNFDSNKKSFYKTKNQRTIEFIKKHWMPDYGDTNYNPNGHNDINILMTHEPLVMGSMNFDKVVQMETYQTDANIVLCADIHTHFGVNQFNDTIFISTGAMTRTDASEKHKKTYFAHIRIENHLNQYAVHVDFIHFLPKDDNPDTYWLDVRKTTLSEKSKIEIKKEAGKTVKDIIEKDKMIDEENLKIILTKMGKKENLSDEDIEILVLM